MSERRACEVLNLQRGSYQYRSVADEQAALRMRIRDLAQARVSYGYRRFHVLLQREVWAVNHQRVYRLYCQEGLMLRNKKPKRQKEYVREELAKGVSQRELARTLEVSRWKIQQVAEGVPKPAV